MTYGGESGDADPLIGQTIGEFQVVRRLAEGGMGAVYLLHHSSFPGIRKVLKVVLRKFAEKPIVRDRFLAEADAMAQLGSHPNIVGIDNMLTLPDGQLGIMIPFVDGVPLDKYLDDYFQQHRTGLPPHRVMQIITHIARALHHAHTHDIVHRDLKPSNVFVQIDDNDGVFCKLLDFGIARRMSPSPHIPSNTSFGPLGTPHFMPPEQHERAAEATAAADVFSLACMIWLMVTGGLPWGAPEDPAILYYRKLQHPPDPPIGKALSPDWEAILRAALQPDPASRPSLGQMMRALANALPSIGRLVPSGTEILQRYGRCFVEESAPDDMTLRNRSNRTLIPAWPERDSSAPNARASAPDVVFGPSQPVNPSQPPTHNDRPLNVAPISMSSASSNGMRPASIGSGGIAPIAGASPAFAIPAGAHAPMPMTTTIGASSGAVVATSPKPARWKLALLGAAATIVAGGGTFALVSTQRQGPSRQPSSTVSTPTGSAPVSSSPNQAPTASPHTQAPMTTAPPSNSQIPLPRSSTPPSAVTDGSGATASSTSPPTVTATPAAAATSSSGTSAPSATATSRMQKPAESRQTNPSTPSTVHRGIPASASTAKPMPSTKPSVPDVDRPPTEPTRVPKFDPNGVIGGQKE